MSVKHRLNSLKEPKLIVGLIIASAVVALAVWTLFHQLGQGTLYDWDEAVYGQVAREMVQRGDWLTPSWNGYHFFDKPPFVFWLMALALKVVNPPELAVRLVPALFGLLTIGLTACLGAAMMDRWVALVAAMLLLIASPVESMSFVVAARQGMLDVPFTAMMVWALIQFWIGFREHRHWLFLGLPLGLAMMIRSISAATIFAIILLSVTLFPMLGERLTRQQWQALGIGFLIAAAIALPWHILQLLWHGRDFLQEYGLTHLMKVIHVESGNRGSWVFYFSVLKESLPSWYWLVPPAIGLATWRLVHANDQRALLLLVWVAVIFALHTLAATKLPWYTLPIYPALALLVAWLLQKLVPRDWLVQEFVAAVLLLGVAAWNLHTISPDNRRWAFKSLGQCVAIVTSGDETIAFFDPSRTWYSDLHPTLNIRPVVRFYAARPMVAFWDRPAVEKWLAEGGRFVWTNSASSRQVEDLFVVMGREGDQLLLRRANWADALPKPTNLCRG